MRKYLMIFTVILLLIITTLQVLAQTSAFHQNDQVVIKSGISYAWLRERPTSDCACVVYTINSPKRVLRILDTSPVSDGTQNWWHVTTITRPIKEGWLEENALRLLKQAPIATSTLSLTPQARQFKTNAVQIRDGISFIWIRNAPSSTAAILQTIKFSRPTSQNQCLTLATVGPVVRWDGQQWWRAITPSSPGRTDIQAGWVEENSLVDCNLQSVTVTTVNPGITPSPSSEVTPLPPTSTYAAYQPFQNGMMIWRQDTQVVYVLVINGGPSQFAVSQYAGLPEPTDVAPASYYTPVNAFGKVWNGINYGEKRFGDRLGWAIAQEQGYTASISGYVVASAAKPNTVTDITLPDGRTVEIETAFPSWHFK